MNSQQNRSIPTLTPLEAWADQAGLPYQQAHRLASKGHIDATQLGQRWYVVGDGLPEGEGRAGDDQTEADEDDDGVKADDMNAGEGDVEKGGER